MLNGCRVDVRLVAISAIDGEASKKFNLECFFEIGNYLRGLWMSLFSLLKSKEKTWQMVTNESRSMETKGSLNLTSEPKTKEIIMKIGDKGKDVEKLQIMLAGFAGGVWDGDFGPGTEKQVKKFQKDYMKMENPTGIVDKKTEEAIQDFDKRYPVNFKKLKCQCGKCDGYGKGRFLGKYRDNKKENRFYLYERPGVHMVIIYMIKYAMFINPKPVIITSGYRCEDDNIRAGRTSVNHRGNAVDLDIVEKINDRKIDMQNNNLLRKLLVENSNCQIGWGKKNVKSLEPAEISPTWLHCDIREYDPKYLDDRFYLKVI